MRVSLNFPAYEIKSNQNSNRKSQHR
jgi:hypothetical protein